MYYKITRSTPLFKKLQEINKGIIAARCAIMDTLKKMGYTGKFASASSSYLVSCDAVEITTGKPEGWKVVGESWQQLYYPKVSNKKDSKILNALPRISNDVINKPLNFYFHVGENLTCYHRPSLIFSDNCVLVSTTSKEYAPVDGMKEILESEYIKLEKQINAEKA